MRVKILFLEIIEKKIKMSADNNDEFLKKLTAIKQNYNLIEPDRGNLDDENIVWVHEKPNYTKANLQFLKGFFKIILYN
jgi:hypothetical protein